MVPQCYILLCPCVYGLHQYGKMLLLFSVKVAEYPPVWEKADHSVYHMCLL